MRIAYLLATFPSTRETFVSNEVIDLLRRGVDVQVFSWNLPTGEIVHPEVQESGILQHTHYFRYRYLPRVLLSWAFWRALGKAWWGKQRRSFRDWRSRVEAAYFASLLKKTHRQHAHTHFFPSGGAVAALADIPCSFTAHCFEEQAMSAETKADYARTLASVPLAIAASEFVQRGMRSLVGPEHHDKIRLVRCGIDVERFAGSSNSEKCYDVLCVAGFSRFKGIEYLIRAAALLRQRYAGLKVVCVGGAVPFQTEFAEWLMGEPVRCGADDVFEFLGPQSSDRVRQLLGESKVFVLPSVITPEGHMDGLPVALMEAAACGLPLISTAVAGIPELVVDGVTGFLVPQRDPEALAEAIDRLLRDDALRERMGQAARRRVEEEFSRELNGQRLLEAFRTVVPV